MDMVQTDYISLSVCHGNDVPSEIRAKRDSGSCGFMAAAPTLPSGRLPAALQFPVSLKQDGSTSLATWHVQIPGKIITDRQETGGDLEGARVPPG